jgi:pimeloyl-ACP methyl ester carboxylesterase
VTNRDVSTPERAVTVEHWYRHRTVIENIFRDAKLGTALRHLPSGYPQVNTAWMWGALLAASIAGWLHQLTASSRPPARLFGHGLRGGQAMIATLRHRLIKVPARLVRHAGMLEHTIIGGGGVKLHVLEDGNPTGRPLLFIHGLSASHLI